MFRFTIRELVLLTLVVAMGVAWWLDHRLQAASAFKFSQAFRAAAGKLQEFGCSAELESDGVVLFVQDGVGVRTILLPRPGWTPPPLPPSTNDNPYSTGPQ